MKDITLDYQINSTATLQLLELFKKYCPEACFINVSTNKVYGDNPNKLKLIEKKIDTKLVKILNILNEV